MNPRRPIPNIAFIPNVERRASGVERIPSASRRSTRNTRPPGSQCPGMTMIELCIVMGIVSVLIALVLGLGRHVNEAVKLRRAQADLGEWHEVLNTWFLKYGMYPDPVRNNIVESNVFWLATTDAATQYRVPDDDGRFNTQIPPFCSLSSKPLNTIDPWGTPYVYQSFTNSYMLFSCGPNRVHQEGSDYIPQKPPTISADPNSDDIYFEP